MLTRSFAACLLAASSAFALWAAPVQAHHDDDGGGDEQSLVTLVDISVQDVDVVEGQLVATAEITLDVVGRKLVRTVDLPIDLGATPGQNGCDILNLSLGPIRLDVLGLMVRLDDCQGGPVTVDIGAMPGQGLLGDLLCNLAGGLVAGDDLQTLYDALTPEEQITLTGLLGFLLSDALGGSLTDCANLPDTQAHAAAAKKRQRKNCDLLTLEIPEGVHLALLGLTVDTSGICLDVWAHRGQGNLLGNLLCSLSDLLDGPGESLGRIRNLTRRIRDAVIDLREMSL